MHDAARMPQRDWTRDERRERQHDLTRHRRDALIRLVREIATGGTENSLGIGTTPNETSQSHRFVANGPLTTFPRVGIPTDLRVDRIAQTETLVPQLGD